MPDNVPAELITVSIVSHGQNALVNALCEDLRRLARRDLHIVLTENCRDSIALARDDTSIEVVVNDEAKGFGANHNAAFSRCATPYFCVCNPDIRLTADPFPALLEVLVPAAAAVAGPLVRSPSGGVEDSARRFPTAGQLLRKLVSAPSGPDYAIDEGPVDVDWIAGMFMLIKRERFAGICGFDERYHLYYEDVDLCQRLWVGGHRVIFQPRAEIVHDARRASRRNLRLMLRHAASAFRYLRSTGSR